MFFTRFPAFFCLQRSKEWTEAEVPTGNRKTNWLLYIYDGNERGDPATTLFGLISMGGKFMRDGI
jgi:hypothetical protein